MKRKMIEKIMASAAKRSILHSSCFILHYIGAAFFILHSSFFISCSDDDIEAYTYGTEEDVADGVYIITSVDDNSYGTRASSISSTSSWSGGDFDEVGINSLSVLFFDTNNTLAYAFKTTAATDTTKRDYVTTSTGATGIRWMVPDYPTSSSTSTEMSSYTLSDATTFNTTVSATPVSTVPTTYTIYAIANHDWNTSDLTIGTTTVSDLKTLLTNTDDSTKMAQQPGVARNYGTFEMSGSITASESYKDYTDEYGVVYRRDYEVELKRAIAKMCIRVYYTAADATTPTLLTTTGSASSTDANDFHNTDHDISFRLVRYAATTPLTADGNNAATIYSKTDGSSGKTIRSLYTQGENAFTDPTTTNGTLYQYGATTTTDDDGNSTTTYDDACVVYYFYPNNWADSSKIEASTLTLNTDVPIVENRQTYVQMQVKHTSSSLRTVTYTYDIPTNYLLPEYNDAISLTDDQKAELYAAYRIDRNTAYWATVYIEEVEAGLRVACSYGSGAAAAIADLEDSPDVVNLTESSITTTLSIDGLDDGTGDGQSYNTSTSDSIFIGYTFSDFSETVDLSNITSITFTPTDSEESTSASFTAETSGYSCTGSLQLTAYTDTDNWTAVSSTTYTATQTNDAPATTADDDGSDDGSTDDTGDTEDTEDTETTTVTYTATVSSITCANTYTNSSGSQTISTNITVTYTITGSDNSTATTEVTYTGTSLTIQNEE